MKYLIVKDKSRRRVSSRYELKNIIVKALFAETYTYPFLFYYKDKILKPNFVRFHKISGLFFPSSKRRRVSMVRVKNRCVLSGRAKSVFRFYKISRICFRELASNGLIPGISKSSW